MRVCETCFDKLKGLVLFSFYADDSGMGRGGTGGSPPHPHPRKSVPNFAVKIEMEKPFKYFVQECSISHEIEKREKNLGFFNIFFSHSCCLPPNHNFFHIFAVSPKFLRYSGSPVNPKHGFLQTSPPLPRLCVTSSSSSVA